MPQAKITVNSVVGSNTNLPIATLVQLDNVNSGGETSYTWSILDQPPGPTDNLSSVAVQNPFFTPKKEGTYLLRLVVNQGLPTQQEDRVVCAIQQIKTLERIPAAGETTEADTVEGWATASNSMLRRIDALLSDPGIIIGVNTSGGTLTRGQVVHAQASAVIKSGLPGQETVPGFSLATSSTLAEVDELLCIVEGTPSGGSSVPGTGTPEHKLMKVRYIGRIASQVIANGPVAAGDTIFVNDSGALDKNEGTIRRRVGSAMAAGSTVDVWFDGVGGAEIDLTPIDRKYVVYGPLGALPNAVRVDGTNASAPSGGVPFQLKAQDDTTITMVLRRHTSSGLSIQEWQTESGTVLAKVGADGKLTIVAGQVVASGASFVFQSGSGALTFQSGASGIAFNTGATGIAFADPAGGTKISWPNWAMAQSAAQTFDFTVTQSFLSNVSFQFLSALTQASWLQTDDLGGTTGVFGSDSNSTGGVLMGSISNSLVAIVVNNNPYWVILGTQITATSPGQISFLADPALAQDAANRRYVDSHDLTPGCRLTLGSVRGDQSDQVDNVGTTLRLLPWISACMPIPRDASDAEGSIEGVNIGNSGISITTADQGGLSADTNYDVFLFDNAAPKLFLKSWSSNTARGFTHTANNGFACNTSDYSGSSGPAALMGLYVGTVRTISSSGVKFSDTVSSRLVFNMFNAISKPFWSVGGGTSASYFPDGADNAVTRLNNTGASGLGLTAAVVSGLSVESATRYGRAPSVNIATDAAAVYNVAEGASTKIRVGWMASSRSTSGSFYFGGPPACTIPGSTGAADFYPCGNVTIGDNGAQGFLEYVFAVQCSDTASVVFEFGTRAFMGTCVC